MKCKYCGHETLIGDDCQTCPGAYERSTKLPPGEIEEVIIGGITFLKCNGATISKERYKTFLPNKETVMNEAPLDVGDVVEPINLSHALRCGSGHYSCAVVINTNPFTLASTTGDMRWQSTVEREHFKFVRKADTKEYNAAMSRRDK